MYDTTDEKLKQRLKDLYDDPSEYSHGQIAEASGMALDRIDALAARLAKVTDDCDDLQIALASARKQLERYIGEAEQRVATLEAALPAVYRLAMEKCEASCQIEIDRGDKNNASAYAVGARSCQAAIRALSTPTAAELMARIQTGEKE